MGALSAFIVILVTKTLFLLFCVPNVHALYLYIITGEVNVADIFAQLEREYHAENAGASNSKGLAG